MLFNGQGQEQAERFVRDFIVPQLIETDVNELWQIINPMGLLTAVLSVSGKGVPEPRYVLQMKKILAVRTRINTGVTLSTVARILVFVRFLVTF